MSALVPKVTRELTRMRRTLRGTFNLDKLRPGQADVIRSVLMKDQVDKLEEAGLEASQLNRALTTREHEENLEQIKTETNDFIFVTPERFTTPAFLDDSRKRAVNFVVIDEVHCISQWGHDFRPAYLSLGAAIKTLGSRDAVGSFCTTISEKR